MSEKNSGQNVGKYDLIIIAENGDAWWVERDPKGGPTGRFEKLDESLTYTPRAYDKLNVVLSDTPQEATQGGATCFVLNWKYLVNRSQAYLEAKKDNTKR